MKQLLPLCSSAKTAIRDGLAGAKARIMLPFYEYGFWFADGSEYVFPEASVRQNMSMGMSGQAMPDTFQKSEGVCLKGV